VVNPIAPHIASSLAGVHQSERQAARETEKTERRRHDSQVIKRGDDNLDLEVSEVEEAEAVRSAKGNDQEETHEDRTSHGYYDAHGDLAEEAPAPRVDLEG